MTRISKSVQALIQQVDRRKLSNNTQRALLALLTTDQEWVSRSSMRIPSVSARLRDLRKAEFGGFDVQCRSLTELQARSESTVRNRDPRSTFYRLNPRTITLSRVMQVFGKLTDKGVVKTISTK